MITSQVVFLGVYSLFMIDVILYFIIDEEIEEEHKAEKNNRNSIPPWTIYKELVYLKRRLDKTAQEIMG